MSGRSGFLFVAQMLTARSQFKCRTNGQRFALQPDRLLVCKAKLAEGLQKGNARRNEENGQHLQEPGTKAKNGILPDTFPGCFI